MATANGHFSEVSGRKRDYVVVVVAMVVVVAVVGDVVVFVSRVRLVGAGEAHLAMTSNTTSRSLPLEHWQAKSGVSEIK